MKKPLTVKTAILRIKKRKPKTVNDFKKIGLPLNKRPIGWGAFREVWKIKGLPLVVKFTIPSSNGVCRDGIWHSVTEVRKVRQLRKFLWIREYLPKIYYHDSKSGQTVMHFYEPFKEKELSYRITYLLEEAIKQATGVNLGDIQSSNFGIEVKDGRKQLKIIDLGL